MGIEGNLPRYHEPEYELLNDFVAHEWAQIKKELKIGRIIKQSFLPVSDIIDIIDGYAFDQQEYNSCQAAALEKEYEKVD